MEITDEMYVYCWDLLDKLELGETLNIAKHAPNKPDHFIFAAKQYHDTYGNLLFKSNYKELKKVLTFEQELQTFN